MVRERKRKRSRHRVGRLSGRVLALIKGLEFRLLTLSPKEITQKYADGIERRLPHRNLKLRSLTKIYHL